MMKPDHQDPNALDNTKLWKKFCFYKFIMNSYYGKVATEMRSQGTTYSPCVVNWEILNNMGCGEEIDEMLRIKLCEAGTNEEIFTSVFNKVCVDDELQTKKIIKFRLCGRAHSLTLLEFARRLGLYHAEELDEEGFDVYFQEARWMKRKGAGTQRESMICCGQFITKTARKARLLSDEVLRNLSTLIYYRALDTTTLRELIDSEGRLIPEAPQPDRYAGVFEYMVGVYNVPMQGAYNPPRYDQQQYGQYYQQYPPQEQKPDDDE
ncbi:hypothetical protein Tco_0717066 [Tanacetum coccineum]